MDHYKDTPQCEKDLQCIRDALSETSLDFDEYTENGKYWFLADISKNLMEYSLLICLDARLKDCQIAVLYPFTVDPAYTYPLCQWLAQVNHNDTNYGFFTYDTKTGSLSYRCILPATHLQRESFRDILFSVLFTAAIHRSNALAVVEGHFDRKAAICKAQELLIRLSCRSFKED